MIRNRKMIATPPGATIQEQLENRGMHQSEFAKRMGLPEEHVSRLINGEAILSHEIALKLESVLGIPAEVWSNLEAVYREKASRIQPVEWPED